ncbi:histidinol dehydrogenase [Candidatus Vidania fulgoroideorum]
MKILNKNEFFKKIKKISYKKIEKKIKKIYKNLKRGKNKYLKKCIRKYDKISSDILFNVKKNIFNKYENKIIKKFIKRIYNFHIIQKKEIGLKNWYKNDFYFKIIGQKCSPIEKVLIYVPGGKYSYISSLIMNYIPAKIAGVKNIYISTPAKGKKFLKIASVCKILNIKKIFRMGGAHCIFSFSIGLKKIPKVNKIIGPGNLYVSLAKKKVFGKVGIDNIAGPTEILIVTDGKCKKNNLINDILAQTEHDINSKAFLISYNFKFLKKIKKDISNLKNIFLIYAKNIKKCIKLSNKIAPEHLEVIIKKKSEIKNFKNYGTMFIGEYSCESLGDYCAGTNHVLPTNSSAKFSSPLGVNDFLKNSNIIKIKKNKFKKIGIYSSIIAKIEGLKFHKKSILKRL